MEAKDVITKNLVYLVDNVENTAKVRSQLLHDGFITNNEKDMILAKATAPEQSQQLFSTLSRKDLNDEKFKKLLSIFNKSGNQHLALQLRSSASPCSSPSADYRNSPFTFQINETDKLPLREPLKKEDNKKRIFSCSIVNEDQILANKWWPTRKILPSYFYERKDAGVLLIEKLHSNLESTNMKTAVISQKQDVPRLGGSGKTTIAKWYANYYEEKYDYILWIDCGEESLARSFENLATALKIENWKIMILEEVARKCFVKLSPFKCLFIYDNAECFYGEKGIRHVLPNCPENRIFSIITSRNFSWGSRMSWKKVDPLLLDVFTKQESIQFLKRILKDDLFSNTQLGILSTNLKHLPLTLEIAASAMNRMPTRIEELIHKLKWTSTNESLGEYEETLKKVLQISISQMRKFKKGKLAQKILLTFLYTQADDIEISFFQKIEKQNKDDVERAITLLEKYSLVSRTKKKAFDESEIEYLSIHRMLQRILARNEKQLVKILSSGEIDLEDKLRAYLALTRKNHPAFSLIKGKLFKQVTLQHLLSQRRFQDAVDFSKLILHDESQQTTNGETEGVEFEMKNLTAKYNCAVCLEKNGQYYEALGELKSVQEKLTKVLSQKGTLKSTKDSKFRVNRNIEIEFDVIGEIIPSIENVTVQICQLHVKMNNCSLALEQFEQIKESFQQDNNEEEFQNLYLICCLIVSLVHLDEKRVVVEVMEAIKKIGKPLINEFLLMANDIDVKGDLWKQMNNTNLLILYKIVYHSMSLAPRITDDYLIRRRMNSFGVNSLKMYEREREKEMLPFLQVTGNIRRRIFGFEDRIFKEIDKIIGIGIVAPDCITEFTWTAENSLDSQFTFLLKTKDLTRINLNGHSFNNQSRIFQSDLVYSLKGCPNLNILTLKYIELVGGGREKAHLPNISHFEWNNYKIRTIDDVHRFKLFYKQNQCLWKDISEINEFYLGSRVKAIKATKSLELFGLQINDQGIDCNYFESVTIDSCKLWSNSDACACEYCTNKFEDGENKVDYSNVKRLTVQTTTVNTQHFDLKLFNGLTFLKIWNESAERDILVEFDFLRNIPNVELRNVNVKCTENFSKQDLNQDWIFSNVNFVDSYGKIILGEKLQPELLEAEVEQRGLNPGLVVLTVGVAVGFIFILSRAGQRTMP